MARPTAATSTAMAMSQMDSTPGCAAKKARNTRADIEYPSSCHWPAGGYTSGRDIDTLIANIDFLPTLCDLCDVPISDDARERINGTSVKPLLEGTDNWNDRKIVTDSQRVENPIKWRKCATMTQRWRLINGEELYDMDSDREQRHNVAEQHPEVVAELRQHYEDWWALVSERFGEDVPIIVGSESEPVSVITTHDWHNENSECGLESGYDPPRDGMQWSLGN